MDALILTAGASLFCLMLPVLYRVVRGPTAIDRIVAINMIGTKAAILLVIIGSIYHSVEMFVDFALTYALLNFFGSVAASRYFIGKQAQGGDSFEEGGHS